MATTYSKTSSGSTSKTYASGKVSDKTKENYEKYSQAYMPSETVQQVQNQLQNLQ